MTTETKPTKGSALALAKRKYGKKAIIQERRNAPTREEREAAQARSKEIGERLKVIAADQLSLKGWQDRLTKAARFVVDVDGDDPSVEQLRPCVIDAERYAALTEEYLDLKKEREQLPSHGYRWTAGNITGAGGIKFLSVKDQADTLAELVEKMERE